MTSWMRYARRLPLALGAAGALVLGSAGQAHADTGGGTFDGGWEIPAERQTLAVGHQCGWFHNTNAQSQQDPTIHTIPMTGDFGTDTAGGNDGTGTATFTITSDWFANELRTHSDFDCDDTTAFAIAGELEIQFDGDDSDWSCTSDATGGSAFYSREGDAYSLTGTVICDNLTTTGTVETVATAVTFTGDQLRCGAPGQPTCNNVAGGSNLEDGTYTWSNSL